MKTNTRRTDERVRHNTYFSVSRGASGRRVKNRVSRLCKVRSADRAEVAVWVFLSHGKIPIKIGKAYYGVAEPKAVVVAGTVFITDGRRCWTSANRVLAGLEGELGLTHVGFIFIIPKERVRECVRIPMSIDATTCRLPRLSSVIIATSHRFLRVLVLASTPGTNDAIIDSEVAQESMSSSSIPGPEGMGVTQQPLGRLTTRLEPPNGQQDLGRMVRNDRTVEAAVAPDLSDTVLD
ncbi:hypothetical protein CHU98_g1778 [Xylaria longipes]|nr:hypothetical protein CHU98_g1778 [Xylaria longipes]